LESPLVQRRPISDASWRHRGSERVCLHWGCALCEARAFLSRNPSSLMFRTSFNWQGISAIGIDKRPTDPEEKASPFWMGGIYTDIRSIPCCARQDSIGWSTNWPIRADQGIGGLSLSGQSMRDRRFLADGVSAHPLYRGGSIPR